MTTTMNDTITFAPILWAPTPSPSTGGGSGGTLLPTLAVTAVDDDGDGAVFDPNGSEEDDGRSILPWVAILGVVMVFWCVGLCWSTRGCRDCRFRDHHNNNTSSSDHAAFDPVWETPRDRQRRLAADYRLARTLQRREAAEAAARAARARTDWIRDLFSDDDDEDDNDDGDDRNRENDNTDSSSSYDRVVVMRWPHTTANNDDVERQSSSSTSSSSSRHTTCCPICLNDYATGDRVCEGASCGHVFHVPCIRDALCRSKYCPVCRRVFLRREMEDDDRDDKPEEEEEEEEDHEEQEQERDDDDEENVTNDEQDRLERGRGVDNTTESQWSDPTQSAATTEEDTTS